MFKNKNEYPEVPGMSVFLGQSTEGNEDSLKDGSRLVDNSSTKLDTASPNCFSSVSKIDAFRKEQNARRSELENFI